MARLPEMLLAFAVLVALATLVACGESELPQDDAVAILELDGFSNAEATCMVDTLVLADELDAVDPRRSMNDRERLAVQSARSRCQSVEALGVDTTDTLPPDVVVPEDDLEAVVSGAVKFAWDEGGFPVELAPEAERIELAVERLLSLGRDDAAARCIVDRLVSGDALWLAEDPEFGLMSSPLEAAAVASCI